MTVTPQELVVPFVCQPIMPWKGEMTIVSRIVLGSSMVPKCAECWHFFTTPLKDLKDLKVRRVSQVIANSPNCHVFQLHLYS